MKYMFLNALKLKYEAEIEVLQNENNQLKAQVAFLKEQLAYKTFGKPSHEDDK